MTFPFLSKHTAVIWERLSDSLVWLGSLKDRLEDSHTEQGHIVHDNISVPSADFSRFRRDDVLVCLHSLLERLLESLHDVFRAVPKTSFGCGGQNHSPTGNRHTPQGLASQNLVVRHVDKREGPGKAADVYR